MKTLTDNSEELNSRLPDLLGKVIDKQKEDAEQNKTFGEEVEDIYNSVQKNRLRELARNVKAKE